MKNRELVLPEEKVISIFLMIGLGFFSAFVGMRLWNWFLGSMFGFVSYWQMYGINLFIGYVKYRADRGGEIDDVFTYKDVGQYIGFILVTWGVGILVSLGV